eukprot:GHVQ01015818.1.p1 GENE.GHVQ01015818.1~~GHVQ01015818.1.p1  ORF type:complete len:1520 (+),score=230.67 GHVQ01015818.1:555-5114(+)
MFVLVCVCLIVLSHVLVLPCLQTSTLSLDARIPGSPQTACQLPHVIQQNSSKYPPTLNRTQFQQAFNSHLVIPAICCVGTSPAKRFDRCSRSPGNTETESKQPSSKQNYADLDKKATYRSAYSGNNDCVYNQGCIRPRGLLATSSHLLSRPLGTCRGSMARSFSAVLLPAASKNVNRCSQSSVSLGKGETADTLSGTVPCHDVCAVVDNVCEQQQARSPAQYCSSVENIPSAAVPPANSRRPSIRDSSSSLLAAKPPSPLTLPTTSLVFTYFSNFSLFPLEIPLTTVTDVLETDVVIRNDDSYVLGRRLLGVKGDGITESIHEVRPQGSAESNGCRRPPWPATSIGICGTDDVIRLVSGLGEDDGDHRSLHQESVDETWRPQRSTTDGSEKMTDTEDGSSLSRALGRAYSHAFSIGLMKSSSIPGERLALESNRVGLTAVFLPHLPESFTIPPVAGNNEQAATFYQSQNNTDALLRNLSSSSSLSESCLSDLLLSAVSSLSASDAIVLPLTYSQLHSPSLDSALRLLAITVQLYCGMSNFYYEKAWIGNKGKGDQPPSDRLRELETEEDGSAHSLQGTEARAGTIEAGPLFALSYPKLRKKKLYIVITGMSPCCVSNSSSASDLQTNSQLPQHPTKRVAPTERAAAVAAVKSALERVWQTVDVQCWIPVSPEQAVAEPRAVSDNGQDGNGRNGQGSSKVHTEHKSKDSAAGEKKKLRRRIELSDLFDVEILWGDVPSPAVAAAKLSSLMKDNHSEIHSEHRSIRGGIGGEMSDDAVSPDEGGDVSMTVCSPDQLSRYMVGSTARHIAGNNPPTRGASINTNTESPAAFRPQGNKVLSSPSVYLHNSSLDFLFRSNLLCWLLLRSRPFLPLHPRFLFDHQYLSHSNDQLLPPLLLPTHLAPLFHRGPRATTTPTVVDIDRLLRVEDALPFDIAPAYCHPSTSKELCHHLFGVSRQSFNLYNTQRPSGDQVLDDSESVQRRDGRLGRCVASGLRKVLSLILLGRRNIPAENHDEEAPSGGPVTSSESSVGLWSRRVSMRDGTHYGMRWRRGEGGGGRGDGWRRRGNWKTCGAFGSSLWWPVGMDVSVINKSDRSDEDAEHLRLTDSVVEDNVSVGGLLERYWLCERSKIETIRRYRMYLNSVHCKLEGSGKVNFMFGEECNRVMSLAMAAYDKLSGVRGVVPGESDDMYLQEEQERSVSGKVEEGVRILHGGKCDPWSVEWITGKLGLFEYLNNDTRQKFGREVHLLVESVFERFKNEIGKIPTVVPRLSESIQSLVKSNLQHFDYLLPSLIPSFHLTHTSFLPVPSPRPVPYANFTLSSDSIHSSIQAANAAHIQLCGLEAERCREMLAGRMREVGTAMLEYARVSNSDQMADEDSEEDGGVDDREEEDDMLGIDGKDGRRESVSKKIRDVIVIGRKRGRHLLRRGFRAIKFWKSPVNVSLNYLSPNAFGLSDYRGELSLLGIRRGDETERDMSYSARKRGEILTQSADARLDPSQDILIPVDVPLDVSALAHSMANRKA